MHLCAFVHHAVVATSCGRMEAKAVVTRGRGERDLRILASDNEAKLQVEI